MTPRTIPELLTADDVRDINIALNQARRGNYPSRLLGLNDSGDRTNILYDSERSPGLRYAYLQTPEVLEIGERVAKKLAKETGRPWLLGINGHCLPLFEYDNGVYIKPHRGRDIGHGANDLVAVTMITVPGTDFSGGRFFLNLDAEPSEDGKTMLRENKAARQYINIPHRGAYLFDNRHTVHGTEPVERSPTGRAQRITVSWRTLL